jgi:hypothetical protein
MMMKYFYSPATRSFYADALRDIYEKAGTWPADAIPLEYGLHGQLMEAQQNGGEIIHGEDGLPTIRKK